MSTWDAASKSAEPSQPIGFFCDLDVSTLFMLSIPVHFASIFTYSL